MTLIEFIEKYREEGRLEINLHDVPIAKFVEMLPRQCKVEHCGGSEYWLKKLIDFNDGLVIIWSEKITGMSLIKRGKDGEGDWKLN
jgi:hypothetical protein